MHAAPVQWYHMMITWFLQTTLWNPYSQLLSTVSIIQQWQQLDDIYQCRALEVGRKFRDGGIIAKSKVIILTSDKEEEGKRMVGFYSMRWVGRGGSPDRWKNGWAVTRNPRDTSRHMWWSQGHMWPNSTQVICPFSSNLPSSFNNTSFNRICNSSTF